MILGSQCSLTVARPQEKTKYEALVEYTFGYLKQRQQFNVTQLVVTTPIITEVMTS